MLKSEEDEKLEFNCREEEEEEWTCSIKPKGEVEEKKTDVFQIQRGEINVI